VHDFRLTFCWGGYRIKFTSVIMLVKYVSLFKKQIEDEHPKKAVGAGPGYLMRELG